MSVLCGVDLIEIARIEKRLLKTNKMDFLKRFMHLSEIDTSRISAQSIAGIFAAKEAIAKALGTGVWQAGVDWHDFLIEYDDYGKPHARLSGNALNVYQSIGGTDIAISISHDAGLAIAFCVIECNTVNTAIGK